MLATNHSSVDVAARFSRRAKVELANIDADFSQRIRRDVEISRARKNALMLFFYENLRAVTLSVIVFNKRLPTAAVCFPLAHFACPPVSVAGLTVVQRG